ncbi:MAG: hypothetical protein C4348_02410, partial [Patescibacteria group bacterium]
MAKFTKPPLIKEGDYIGLIAPSDGILDKKEIEKSMRIVEKWGLKIKLGKYVFAKEKDRYVALPQEKQEDLRLMIEDPEIKIIWSVYGGYSANDVLPVFNKQIIEKLKNNPKWFIGYSDISLILNTLSSYKILNIHGPNFVGLSELTEDSINYLKKILFEGKIEEIDSSHKWSVLIPGEAEGIILASNLESLIFNLGTRFDPILHGKDDLILAIEDIFVEKSAIARMIDTLLNHKKAHRIKGLILGRFVGIYEADYSYKYQKTSYEKIIESRIKNKKDIVLVKLEEFGHSIFSLEENLIQKIFQRKKEKKEIKMLRKIKPKNNYLLIEPIQERTTKSGIVIPEVANLERPIMMGKIVS